MVPLLSLGIPGGNAAAIMMSALVLKGVTMGPLLLVNQPQFPVGHICFHVLSPTSSWSLQP